jgi:hypothetical protein
MNLLDQWLSKVELTDKKPHKVLIKTMEFTITFMNLKLLVLTKKGEKKYGK